MRHSRLEGRHPMDGSGGVRWIGAIALGGALLCLIPRVALGQSQPELVDQIVAIVGDTAILQSELQEHVFRLQAQGYEVPTNRGQLRTFMKDALEQRISEMLLIVQARREGITVSETDVNEVIDREIATIKSRFPSELAFQQALVQSGMTAAEFRIQMAEQARSQLLAERYLGERVSGLQPVPISESEIRERFEAQREMLGEKPATISLRQIVLSPRPSEEAELAALKETETALSRARSGEDFARLAREYSDDPGSREAGGELGWARRGRYLPEFDEALFSMDPGDISDPIKTDFGYHIIKLELVRGPERFARHILIQPEIGEADEARTDSLTREIVAALEGGADVDSLSRLYHDPLEQELIERFPMSQLPPQYAAAVQSASDGDIVGPFNIPAPGLTNGKTVVLKVLEVSPGGEWRLSDVRDHLRNQIQQEKMLEQVVIRLRSSTYVEARDDAVDEFSDLFLSQMLSAGRP